MAPQNEVHKCPTCKKNVTKTQKSVGCACCGLYFHLTCGKVTSDEFNFMAKHKVVKFVCSNCPNLLQPSDIQEELRKGFSALTTSLEKEFELKLQESKRELQDKLDAAVNAIKLQIDDLAKNFFDNKSQIKDIKSEIDNCCNVVKHIDVVTGGKINSLEIQSNIDQRRLNRSNIIIRGLPKSIANLREPIIKIGNKCNVDISNADIHHCTYFRGDKAVLVKFNSVQVRDQIMINYHKNIAIALKDIIGGNIESRIYLNDHLTPAAKKLVDVCKQLKLNQNIKKYTHLNYDIPKARIEMVDGTVSVFNYDQCLNMFNESSDIDGSSNQLAVS